MSKLIFGCGYLGRRVARRWRDAGEEVFVVTRSGRRARDFAEAGYKPIVADVVRPASLVNLPVAESVLYSIGYDREAGASMHEVYVAGLKSVLDALPDETGKLLYISTTGVYGQSRGEWVDEDSPCEPRREAASAFVEAEQALKAHRLASRAVTLRLAGLYGPGRIPNATEIRRNQPIASPRQGFLNLIHVDDAVAVVLAAERRAKAPRTFVVSDGNPVQRHTYIEELARLLRAPPPRFAPPPADSPANLRAGSDKRVKNTRLLAELSVQLVYPSYREGLAAIVAAETEESAGE
jgi:nucleoside-diphosphate-sugar epimerase